MPDGTSNTAGALTLPRRPTHSHDEPTLGAWARQLGLKPGSDDWFNFVECATVAAGHILANKALAGHPPPLTALALAPTARPEPERA